MSHGCSKAIIELRDRIRKDLEDEDTAAQKYHAMAEEFMKMGNMTKANIMRLIGGQEQLHRVILESLVETISLECEKA